jgi:hypothetical protein
MPSIRDRLLTAGRKFRWIVWAHSRRTERNEEQYMWIRVAVLSIYGVQFWSLGVNFVVKSWAVRLSPGERSPSRIDDCMVVSGEWAWVFVRRVGVLFQQTKEHKDIGTVHNEDS